MTDEPKDNLTAIETALAQAIQTAEYVETQGIRLTEVFNEDRLPEWKAALGGIPALRLLRHSGPWNAERPPPPSSHDEQMWMNIRLLQEVQGLRAASQALVARLVEGGDHGKELAALSGVLSGPSAELVADANEKGAAYWCGSLASFIAEVRQVSPQALAAIRVGCYADSDWGRLIDGGIVAKRESRPEGRTREPG